MSAIWVLVFAMLVVPPLRQTDAHGAGYFGAPRGSRKHNGVDVACCAGSQILAVRAGKVTKLGYPYNPNDPKKGHLRYVEVSEGNRHYRYFYVAPSLQVGDMVKPGDCVGEVQNLTEIYPGITPHFHFEIKLTDGSYLDPTNLIIRG